MLMTLAKKLYERGHDTKLYLTNKNGYENNSYFARYHDSDTVDEDTIVIYIDIPEGNILNAKRIVRYITYGSHWYPSYTSNEMTYYHAPFAKDNPAKKRLCILYLDPCVRRIAFPRIRNAVHVIKKGNRSPSVRATLNSTNQWTMQHGKELSHQIDMPSMIRIFNQTTYFYCYDPCCFLILVALLCGCIVVQYPADGCTEAEWRYMIGIENVPGIAYGIEGIPRAIATRSGAETAVRKLIAETDMHVDNFIRDMKGPPVYEPCFRFNESPHALQHIVK